MQEVEAVRDVNLLVLGLDPCQLVHHLVPPLVHALVANVHLRVEDPQEAEAFVGELLDGDVDDLLVAHRGVLQVEFVVRKHEAGVVPLGTLDSPWRVNHHNLEWPKFLDQELEVEESEVAVDVSLRPDLVPFFLDEGRVFRLVFGEQVPRHYFCLRLNWNVQFDSLGVRKIRALWFRLVRANQLGLPVALQTAAHFRIDCSFNLFARLDRSVPAKMVYDFEEIFEH